MMKKIWGIGNIPLGNQGRAIGHIDHSQSEKIHQVGWRVEKSFYTDLVEMCKSSANTLCLKVVYTPSGSHYVVDYYLNNIRVMGISNLLNVEDIEEFPLWKILKAQGIKVVLIHL